ncbi:MAG: hypothetical protein AB7R40_23220 [Nitrospiraceae bacterium]
MAAEGTGGNRPLGYRGYASGRDWNAQGRYPERKRYIYKDKVESGHQVLVEVVPLPADAPATPPVGSLVVGREGLVRVLTPPYRGYRGDWYIQVQIVADTTGFTRSVLVETIKTVTVKVTGTQAQLDEYKNLMNTKSRAALAGCTVELVEE